MKICFVTEHYPPHIGGVEIVFQNYAKHLALLGHEVKVLTSDSGGVSGTRTVDAVETHYIPSISLFGHPLLPKKEMKRHIQWADVIHTTTFTAALPTFALSKKYTKPCILTVHEVLGKKWFSVEKNPLIALGFFLFERYVIQKEYTLWHVISKATEHDLKKCHIPQEKIFLLYHGVDRTVWNPNTPPKNLSNYLGFSSNDAIFLYTGRPGKSKGIFILLKAIQKIKSQIHPRFKFGFILGKEPSKERLVFERLILEYALQESVSIKDSVPIQDLPGYRKAAYAMIIPSQTEGFGFVAAESSQLNVPIISSDAGSLSEVSGGKVLFFRNGDINDLSEKILLATKGKFLSVPKKEFDWKSSTLKLITHYKSVL